MMWQTLFVQPWPWWLGAAGLSLTAFFYCWLMQHPLGISGLFSKAVFFRETQAEEQLKARMETNQEALRQAMQAATQAHMAQLSEADRARLAAAQSTGTEEPEDSRQNLAEVPLSASLVTLIGLVLGGLLGQILSGQWTLSTRPQGDFTKLVVDGLGFIPVLFFGGILIGFGTAMAGGCTSGHGLNGCARMQTGSLGATASFFGTAIAVAFALKALI